MAVAFEELDNSPRFTLSREGFVGTRRFKVPWADAKAFCIELVGNSGLGAAGILASSPAGFPGFTNAVCRGAEVVALSPEKITNDGARTDHATEINTYEDALVVATYETLSPTEGIGTDPQALTNPTPPTGTIVEWNRDFGGQMLTIPSRSFQWTGVTGNTIVSEDVHPAIFIPITEYSATWHFVRRPPESAIRRLRGTVNSSPFHGAAAECLLFAGAQDSFSTDLNGEKIYKLTYSFTEKTVTSLYDGTTVYSGWQYYLREGDPSAASPGNATNWARLTPAPYPTGDFNDLFNLEP